MRAGTVRLIGNDVVRETLDGAVVIASCRTDESAQAALRLLSTEGASFEAKASEDRRKCSRCGRTLREDGSHPGRFCHC